MSENRDNCGNNFFSSASHMRSEITRRRKKEIFIYVVYCSMLYAIHGPGWKFDDFPSIFHSKIYNSVRQSLHEAHSIPINIPKILLTSILITRTSRYTKNKFSWPFDAPRHFRGRAPHGGQFSRSSNGSDQSPHSWPWTASSVRTGMPLHGCTSIKPCAKCTYCMLSVKGAKKMFSIIT